MKKFLAIALSVVVLLSLLTGCSGGTSSSAAPSGDSNGTYTITLAHSTTEVTSFHKFATSFKENVEAKSNGKIVVNIYPNAQLGGDREIIEGTQTGSVTLIGSSAGPQVNFVKSAVINDLPFVFADKTQARKVLSDEEYTAAISAEYEKAGFKYLGSSDQGFRALTANKEVHSPSDVQGMTLRTMENKYHMEVWKQIGANPTPLPFNELYTALQQGTVDAQENPIELIYSQKFYEQQDYVIATNHIYQPVSWIMNKAFYDSLPDDLKSAVDESAKQAIADAISYQDENLEKFTQEMVDKGVKVIELTPDEQKAFSEKAKSTWEMIKADCEPAVYDAFMKALNK